MVGGAAGLGVETCGELIELIVKRSGYELFSMRDYMSRVRGGHNFTKIRFSDRQITDYKKKIDVLIAVDAETIAEHINEMQEGAILIADIKNNVSPHNTIDMLQLPFAAIAQEIGNPKVLPLIMAGAFAKAFAFSLALCKEIIRQKMKAGNLELNLQAFEKGYEASRTIEALGSGKMSSDKTMLISGAEAAALGAIAGGIGFYSAYPMTPATSVMTWLSKHDLQAKIVVEQAEDEIAAIHMAIGASYAGVRAMTGTSGGGFALMVEALSLTGVMELPLVVLISQRPGPATGLPTRTEQGDLMFALHAGHGEFPRFIMALRHPLDAFASVARAFNIAEKYQVPVIVLTDQHLSDSKFTVSVSDFTDVVRGIADNDSYMQQEAPGTPYKRYDTAFGPVSPMLFPGNEMGILVAADSHEHNEDGHITEDIGLRNKLHEKRLLKLQLMREDVAEPEYLGVKAARSIIVGWGSSRGAIQSAIAELAQRGHNVAGLVFGDIWPLPTRTLQELAARHARFYFVEQNATGQFERLVRMETGIASAGCLRKYDGRPLNAEEIVELYISGGWGNA